MASLSAHPRAVYARVHQFPNKGPAAATESAIALPSSEAWEVGR
jgi:hypothetical protein